MLPWRSIAGFGKGNLLKSRGIVKMFFFRLVTAFKILVGFKAGNVSHIKDETLSLFRTFANGTIMPVKGKSLPLQHQLARQPVEFFLESSGEVAQV